MGGPAAHCFVLAGGRGTRFWPLSRHAHPKQFLDFTGDGSLLALTLDRISALVPAERQWVITAADLVEDVRAALPQIPNHQIIGEPVGRNTAPAVALAAALLEQQAPGSPFVLLPSDHLISPVEKFQDALSTAIEAVSEREILLTFGIQPTRAETGYGYIEVESASADGQGRAAGAHFIRPVTAFREKPDRATAQAYLDGGRHFWNSGMFAWRSDVVLDQLGTQKPDMVALMRQLASEAQPGTQGFDEALDRAYGAVESISIDYALLEKSQDVVVLPVNFGWNDVGHWLAMRDLWPLDKAGNAASGEIVPIDSRDNIILGGDRLTALLGVSGLIVVQTDDATLICSEERAQDIGALLTELKSTGRTRWL